MNASTRKFQNFLKAGYFSYIINHPSESLKLLISLEDEWNFDDVKERNSQMFSSAVNFIKHLQKWNFYF